jgi:hypothetical protein
MIERPSPGEQIAGIAGLALILTMFLFAWFGFDVPSGVSVSGLDAFDAFSDWFDIILVFAGFGGIMLALFGNGVARLPIPLSVVTTVLAGIGTIVTIIYVISPPGAPGAGGGVVEVSLTREFGLWLGLIEVIALTYGGYRCMQEEGVSFGDSADRLSGPGGGWPGQDQQQHPGHQEPPYHQPPPPPALHPGQQEQPYQQPPAPPAPPQEAPPAQYEPPQAPPPSPPPPPAG